MTALKPAFCAALTLMAVPVLAAAPAQTNTPACSAAIADHATASGVDLVVGTNVFNGEFLKTRGDGRLVVQCKTVRLSLAPDSEMRVFQYETITSVEVEQGVVAYSTLGQSENLALYALDVKIVPDTKQPTFGQVDVASHCELSVQSIKGNVAVTSAKETKIVEESKTYDVIPKLGVDYSDDWRPVLEDYPDYPREAKYHESHHHVVCAAAPLQNASARPLLTPQELHELIFAGGAAGGGAIVWHLMSESQSKP